jgi:hypothetical protein
MIPKKKLAILLIIFGQLLSVGCATSRKRETHLLQKIILYNLHFRRPPQIGAGNFAEHLDLDFESNPKPNSHLDCEPLKSLFAEVDLARVRQCLSSMNDVSIKRKITYHLKREVMPFFELDSSGDDETSVSCVQEILQTLPVPREIYFQAPEAGRLSCYNARIPLVEEEMLGIKNFLFSTRLSLTFPITPLPEGDEETILLLGTWIMAPFFNSNGAIESKIVPRDLCTTCFGGKGLFLETDSLPPFWP